MAITLSSKAPSEVIERRWTIPVDDDDSPGSASLSASGVTVDSNSFEGNDLVLVLSAGTAGTTGSITATITTSQGRVLVETIYISIVLSTARLAPTARDVCYFALRPVFGISETPSADALTDALERLNMTLATWKESGADVGTILPVVAATTLNIPDDFVTALKYRLLIDVAGIYGYQPSKSDVQLAQSGMQRIKHALLPDKRAAAYY
jgi:hypothetical protein